MTNVKNYFTKQPQQIISALILTGILSLSTGLTLLQSATAAPRSQDVTGVVKDKDILISDRGRGRGERDDEFEYERDDEFEHERGRGRGRGRDDEFEHERGRGRGRGRDRTYLLSRVANAVRLDLSRKSGIPPEQLKIINSSRETWSDGCFGLGSPVEQCLQAQVEGWRVTLSDGRSSWIYRTDYAGQVLRLENQSATATNLPKSVADAVLRDASRRSRLPSDLRIVEAERRQWSDGCLGLRRPGILCTAVVVPGWLVTVEAGQQRLVYRTGDFGSGVVFDQAASNR